MAITPVTATSEANDQNHPPAMATNTLTAGADSTISAGERQRHGCPREPNSTIALGNGNDTVIAGANSTISAKKNGNDNGGWGRR